MSLPQTLILVVLLLRPQHPGDLRLASLLPCLSLHEKQGQRAPSQLPPLERICRRVTIQLPIFNEMYVADRLIARSARWTIPRSCSRSRSWTTRPTRRSDIAELAVRRHAARGFNITLPPPGRSPRLQGRGARGRAARRRPAEFIAIFDADFIPSRRLPDADAAALRNRPENRDGAGAVGAHQPGLFAADEDPVDPARRALRARARRPQPGGLLLQLQRHRRASGAAKAIESAGRLAARHADRGSRPQLPRAAARLALRLPARPRRAGRSAGRDELVQVAAAPLGEGVDPDLHEAAAADPAIEPAASASRPKRSSTCRRTSITC